MMINFIEQLAAAPWSRLRRRECGAWQELVSGSRRGRWHVGLSNARRAMHIAVLGKTGTGKSSFLRYLSQHVETNRGFLYFDLHGDGTPFLKK
jgi:Cdc6-like AAA superfamily ATPase